MDSIDSQLLSSKSHDARDHFILETYLLLGAGTIGIPSFLPTECAWIVTCSFVSYLLFFICFLRFSCAAYAAYKYLFAIHSKQVAIAIAKRKGGRRRSNKGLEKSLNKALEKREKEEERFRKMRDLHVKWYWWAIASFTTLVFLKMISLLSRF